jgi:hypothetical protein
VSRRKPEAPDGCPVRARGPRSGARLFDHVAAGLEHVAAAISRVLDAVVDPAANRHHLVDDVVDNLGAVDDDIADLVGHPATDPAGRLAGNVGHDVRQRDPDRRSR